MKYVVSWVPRAGITEEASARSLQVFSKWSPAGNFTPQCAQLVQPCSTAFPHCGQCGRRAAPQCGQNAKLPRETFWQPGHGFGRGSRRMKYAATPMK